MTIQQYIELEKRLGFPPGYYVCQIYFADVTSKQCEDLYKLSRNMKIADPVKEILLPGIEGDTPKAEGSDLKISVDDYIPDLTGGAVKEVEEAITKNNYKLIAIVALILFVVFKYA